MHCLRTAARLYFGVFICNRFGCGHLGCAHTELHLADLDIDRFLPHFQRL
jgi:hypothetical protein